MRSEEKFERLKESIVTFGLMLKNHRLQMEHIDKALGGAVCLTEKIEQTRFIENLFNASFGHITKKHTPDENIQGT